MQRIFLFLMFIYSGFNVYALSEESALKDYFKSIENKLDGKIGVYALNTHNKEIISHRENEKFPVQSTMKVLAISALLKKSENETHLLNEKIFYSEQDFVFWHPITGKYVDTGMTLHALSEAAISYSDNTAANLIIKRLGGPTSITNFAHSIGNKSFNVIHYESQLNSNPKEDIDTSTPKDMAISVQKLTLGDFLSNTHRKMLLKWMQNNTTGDKRIRAGVPNNWFVAEKTGSGDFGIANDVGIAWSDSCKPIVISIFTIRNKQNSQIKDDVLASITRELFKEFSKNDECLRRKNYN